MDYKVKTIWRLSDGEAFYDNKYSRGHRWIFDGGVEVPASSSPFIVPLPYSIAEAVDPEEALVASVSSCHMLWFLSIAAKKRYRVLSYVDDAVGHMSHNEKGKLFISKIILTPHVVFSDDKIPSADEIIDLHALAHADCFIANSLLTEVIIDIPKL